VSRRIGILGGISYESTHTYYRRIHQRYYEIRQDYDYPEVLVYSLNFRKFTDYENHDRENYIAYILEGVRGLEKAGAELIVMAANSPHSVYPEIVRQTGTPILSIAEETVRRAREMQLKNLLLLGIKHTMDADFYPRAGAVQGIQITVPSEQEKRIIDTIIFSELCLGTVNAASRRKLIDIVSRYEVDGVILGCTELPLILGDADLPVAALDTVEIHVQAALRECLSFDA
jgi:aspartate racemase